ncbi:hypothetical protein FGG24_gp04 [Mycobacterium phage JC27]|uniref:Terminase small subunit n=1 Tax=Mycobacterium phage JC27 TaxID=2922210 RepID=G1D353_9CAUD|nr:hypothetical protein FGG24_gp04 [Mycobacterium phage JC27]AEK09203.1 hypothetical protein PBI_JC27_4 [Mycobacterium phage JC27]UVK60554.1 terminase small subunit [Mycobacterium phage Peterson]
MGVRGPVPNRSDQRVRRNKDEYGEVTTIPSKGPVKVPPLDFEDPHPIIVHLYRSLADSAQSVYYQPSDWSYARFTLHFADQLLKSSKPSAQMLASVQQMLSQLLVSEGERRRVRIEVEHNQSGSSDATVTDIGTMFKEHLQKGRQTG